MVPASVVGTKYFGTQVCEQLFLIENAYFSTALQPSTKLKTSRQAEILFIYHTINLITLGMTSPSIILMILKVILDRKRNILNEKLESTWSSSPVQRTRLIIRSYGKRKSRKLQLRISYITLVTQASQQVFRSNQVHSVVLRSCGLQKVSMVITSSI